ncbi:MAG: hypothetical protein ACW97Z_08055 [Candidatus Hodarchaeales archaeon]|jgi:hypothetical protein
MVDPLLLGVVFILLICLVIIIRRTEIIPYLYIYFTARKDLPVNLPSDFGLEAIPISFPVKDKLQKAWFFPNKQENDSTILMIPDWINERSFENSLKTSGVLQLMGFNVLLPVIHTIDESTRLLLKKNYSPRYYTLTIIKAYEYLISRDNLDKRKIAIYSESLSTLLASALVKDQPIKAVILENGPIPLSTLITRNLSYSGFGVSFFRFLTRVLLWPFLWRTRWDRHHSLSMLHSCPTFLISVFDHKDQPNQNIIRNFTSLYKPKQLWVENALLPTGGIRDTWPEEYFSQVKEFYNRWLNKEPAPEWHCEMKVSKKGKKKFSALITISALPPQMDHIPVLITVSDGKNQLHHKRVWFLGAEETYEFQLPFRSSFHSLLPLLNVERVENKSLPWIKLDAEEALTHTVKTIVSLKLPDLVDYEDRYFKIKPRILADINLEESEEITPI